MDIGTIIQADKVAEFEVKHPITLQGTGIFVSVHGKHSQVFRAKMNGNINARQAQAALDSQQGRSVAIRTVEASEAENAELLASCVAGWRTGSKTPELEGAILYKGEQITASFANVKKVLLDPDMRWLLEQIDLAVGKLENFTKA